MGVSGSLMAGGMFSQMVGMGMKEITPIKSYTVDTAGYNPRIYEFRLQSDKRFLCVMAYGNNKGEMQIFCVNTAQKN